MELIAVLIVLVLGFLGISFFKRAKLEGEKAIALSRYAAQFDLAYSIRIHDWTISCLVNAWTREGGRAFMSNLDYLSAHLEIAVAFRDRVDEVMGRTHGADNKVRIRSELALATSSLTKHTPYNELFELKKRFRISDDFKTNDMDWLSMHLEIMKRVYLQPT